MIRILTPLVAIAAFSQPAFAGNTAQYGLGIGISPFGGSLNASYHHSKKTSLNIALGGAPSMEGPMKPTIEDTEYTQTGESTWVGAFLNHRPFKDADWFRFNTGIGIGSIESELEDADGNVYKVEYNENPVGYIGIGFGSSTKEGFTVGFDLGWLQSSGPEITQTAGDGEDASEAIGDTFGFGNVLPNLQLTFAYNF
ncbi:MAG: hypothetical protein CL930_11155 [Deltaproteobacteria bacterium]|nr:hypothetical protein [Deltaproteobacteria bacterium]